MFVIGLTGGIACGKSAVSDYLERKQVPIVDTDVISRQLVEPGSITLNKLVEVFGDGILTSTGGLDRKRLAKLVFSDRDMLSQLNEIMHPAIWKAALERLAVISKKSKIAVLVAPLLYEHGAEAFVDTVWAIGCDKDRQLRRLQDRDGLSLEEARQRLESQMSMEYKLERADVAIFNDGTLEKLYSYVDEAWENLSLELSDLDVEDRNVYNREFFLGLK